MLNIKAFNKIFVCPGGGRTNEEGKPRKTTVKNEEAVYSAIKEIKIALVSDIIKHTGLKNDTIGRALLWLKHDKRVEECSTVMICSRKTPQYSVKGD